MKLVIDGAGDTGQGQLTRLIASHQHCQHHNFAIIIITITIIFITIKTTIIIIILTICCTKQFIPRRRKKVSLIIPNCSVGLIGVASPKFSDVECGESFKLGQQRA